AESKVPIESKREETFSRLALASNIGRLSSVSLPLTGVVVLIWYNGFPASLNNLYFSPEDFNILFTSAWAITGKVLAYNKNSTKKNPMVPINVPMSTKVGENMVHAE